MSGRMQEEERQRLILQIKEWNANRLDLFELSLPDENLEFHGVMRFFFQDEGSKVATKCIRVSSTANTHDVLNTLVEKFRPDMRMLSMPNYSLYEVHVNGEERQLSNDERPLLVQLNWGKDDREGRFLLKREGDKPINIHSYNNAGTELTGPGFKRKLSKREKKEKKKREKEEKLRNKENQKGVAEKLYNELPETSFTRSISNPEAVMRKRRQLKLEKKLQQIRSKDGGPDSGGTLKIYGDTLNPDVPYKTLLLSTIDTAAFVVKETLDKYGLEKENSADYCLIQVTVPVDPEYHHQDRLEKVLDDQECPLLICMQYPPERGQIMFRLLHRSQVDPALLEKKGRRGKRSQGEGPGYPAQAAMPQELLPYLMEVNPDGSYAPKPKAYRLQMDVTEVGGEEARAPSGQYLQLAHGGQMLYLFGPNIQPRHCVIAHTEGVVTVTPTSPQADTYVDGIKIHETSILRHGMVVRFGQMNTYRFCDPRMEERMMKAQEIASLGPQGQPYETSFDLDGKVHSMSGNKVAGQNGEPPYGGPPGYQPRQDMLPASLEFRENTEDGLLAAINSEVSGLAVQFKLAPTYTLYMAARHHVQLQRGPNGPQRLAAFLNKVANMVQHTIEENKTNAGSLSFWMANASELLHFFKQDRDLSPYSLEAQDGLADAVERAFRHLVVCMQMELQNCMLAFLDNTDDDMHANDDMQSNRYSRGRPVIGDVLTTLSSAMGLLRRCRVNAALTIQLFSQLFHFINMWLFNKLVLEPRLQLCSQLWGARLKRRLGKVGLWAEKQGLELAADCHLSRIMQAAHLLQAPKASADDIASISSTCFKLNSLQLRALLQNYMPGPGEPRIPQDLIENVVQVAENTADELTRSDGRDVRLEEEPDLNLPFLLPEDGYSCDIVRGIPTGLGEFITHLSQAGLCRMLVHQDAPGLWTIHMAGEGANLEGPVDEGRRTSGPNQLGEEHPGGLPPEPEVTTVQFAKVNGSLGLSIVAAKGEGQEKRGIYIKSVVPGGGAAMDGRLQAGDQLLEVDGKSLMGLTQERAAELMVKTGQVVTLRVAKQGAIYHGLATLLSQPSPTLPRASPHKGRPHEFPEDPYLGDPRPGHGPQRPLNKQIGAVSSPALRGAKSQEYLPREEDPYGGYPKPGLQGPFTDGGELRSKSVTNLNQPEPRQPAQDFHNMSTTNTLPHHFSQHPQHQAFEDNRAVSQPSLTHRDDPRNYENYPHDQQPYGHGPYAQQEYGGYQQRHPRSPYDADPREEVKTSLSMGNIREDLKRTEPLSRPKSEELNRSRVEEWQRRNEDSMRQETSYGRPEESFRRPDTFRRESDSMRDPRTPPGSYGPPNGPQVGPSQDTRFNSMPPTSQPSTDFRYGGEMQPYQSNLYQASTSKPDDGPPFDSNRGQKAPPPKPKPKPVLAPKPAIARKPGPGASYTENRFSQSDLYSNKSEPLPGQDPNFQPQTSRGGPQSSPYGQGSSKPSMPSPHGRPDFDTKSGYTREKSPLSRIEQYDRRNRSPDLPPPPEVPPELPPLPDGYQDELPPPPPPPANDYGRQMQEEQELMRKMGQMDIRDQKKSGFSATRAEPFRPPGSAFEAGYPTTSQGAIGTQPPSSQSFGSYQQEQMGRRQIPPTSQTGFTNYQNLPPKDQRLRQQNEWVETYPIPTSQPDPRALPGGQPTTTKSPQTQYPYTPRPAPATNMSRGNDLGPQSPSKHRLLADEASRKARGTSPGAWERSEKEQQQKLQEEEMKRKREREIADLESRPYLNSEERERLQRLKLDQEFQRRAEEVGEEEDDSDNDSRSRSQVRMTMLRTMREDMERKSEQMAIDRQQREAANKAAAQENAQIQERRLQQFEQERKIQKERELRQQKRKERETEEMLRKQREQREQERREQEEQLRQQRMEEERQREKHREEMRKKREMEREELRSMQMAQEETNRRLSSADDEIRRMDRYGRLHLTEPTQSYTPAPPERRSSYETSSQGQHRAGSLPPSGQDASQPYGQPPPRSSSAHMLRPAIDTTPKKSVSFHDRLAPEAGQPVDPPVSDGYGYQPPSSGAREPNYPYQPAGYHPPPVYQGYQPPEGQPNYPYRGGMSQADSRQAPYSQYNSMPPTTPTSAANSMYNTNLNTPGNTYDPQLVTGSTPGVVGAQEVYRDPRDRIAAQKSSQNEVKHPSPERISFRDKMRMFATEIGENTPKDRTTISRAQRDIEHQITSVNGR